MRAVEGEGETLIEAAEHSVGSKEGAVSARRRSGCSEDYESRNMRLQEVSLIEELKTDRWLKSCWKSKVGNKTVSGFLPEVGEHRSTVRKNCRSCRRMGEQFRKAQGEENKSRRGRKRLRYLLLRCNALSENPE